MKTVFISIRIPSVSRKSALSGGAAVPPRLMKLWRRFTSTLGPALSGISKPTDSNNPYDDNNNHNNNYYYNNYNNNNKEDNNNKNDNQGKRWWWIEKQAGIAGVIDDFSPSLDSPTPTDLVVLWYTIDVSEKYEGAAWRTRRINWAPSFCVHFDFVTQHRLLHWNSYRWHHISIFDWLTWSNSAIGLPTVAYNSIQVDKYDSFK